MRESFRLKSTRVVGPDGIAPGIVCVSDGRVESILPHPINVECEDLGSLAILPGLVDSHVHLNDPGRTEWERFEDATRAAVSGGVTALVDMPLNCDPVTTSAAAFEQKLEATHGRLFADVGFWSGVVPGNLDALEPMAQMGALGAKAFMVHSGLDAFAASDRPTLRAAMGTLARLGHPLLVHAELEQPVERKGDSWVYRNFMESRPPEWEEAAIDMILELAEETGCHVHIVHLAAASAVERLADARKRGVPVTVETCPHYLLLDAASIEDGQTEFKCCPPIRGADNQARLWDALQSGVIDMIATDHSPCPPEMKLRDTGDFNAAWGGIASLGLALPLVWREASARGFELTDIARWMAEVPARLAGIDDRKGRLIPGLDADLVVFEPEVEGEVSAETLHFRNRLTPFEGHAILGRVRRTYLRGHLAYEDGVHHPPEGEPLLGRTR